MLWYLAAAIVLLVWMSVVVEGARGLPRIPHLSDLDASADPAALPRLSVVVPARNEATWIGKCLQSLLMQDYPGLEVICVDHRSTDETGSIAEEIAARSGGTVRVIHITELPKGWLGKCNAMSVGAAAATGEYILFTDADIVFELTALRRAAAFAKAEDADLMVAFPEIVAERVAERAMVAAFFVNFVSSLRPWRALERKSSSFVGVGAFNMVKRSHYKRINGHNLLRLQVLDDVCLGKFIKHSGGRVRMAFASDMVRVCWYDSLSSMIRGLEKNAFAATGYRTIPAIILCLAILFVGWWPFVGLFFGPVGPRILCALTLAGPWLLIGHALNKFGKLTWLYAYTFPLGQSLIAWTILRSMWVTLRQGGIRWRDSFYSLGDLRQFKP
jgi:glycosyltransferase involved in cell wall biosynthesis